MSGPSRSTLARALVLALVLWTGCAGSGSTAKTEGEPQATETTDVGVVECDAFLRKQQACFEAKLAPEALAAASQKLEETRRTWRAMRGDPRTRNTLAMSCATAARDAGPAMQELGCDW